MITERILPAFAAQFVACLLGCATSVWAQSPPPPGPLGIVVPTVFPPFNANAAPCTKPPGLRKVLAFAQDNEREFMQGVAPRTRRRRHAIAASNTAAPSRNNDAAKMIEQVRAVPRRQGRRPGRGAGRSRFAGSHSLQEIMWAGAYVGAIVPPPATSLLNAPQYRDRQGR
jgi:ribose transport system substrate-binding protein